MLFLLNWQVLYINLCAAGGEGGAYSAQNQSEVSVENDLNIKSLFCVRPYSSTKLM